MSARITWRVLFVSRNSGITVREPMLSCLAHIAIGKRCCVYNLRFVRQRVAQKGGGSTKVSLKQTLDFLPRQVIRQCLFAAERGLDDGALLLLQ